MLYLFFWENYFRKTTLRAWKDVFVKKYSEFNIFHIHNFWEYEINFYAQNLLSSGFFSEKNLFIIDDFPWLSGETSDEVEKYTTFFLENLSKISPEHTVIFNQSKVDKRSKLYKYMLQHAEIKDFEIPDVSTLKSKLVWVYEDRVPSNVLDVVIELKGNNFENIKNELDKILITKEKVTLADLDHISKDLEENIFDIITLFLNSQTKTAVFKLRELASFLDNHYLLYNSLLGNFRLYFYVFLLQKQGVSSVKIKSDLDLWKRAFLVERNYKIKKEDFLRVYEKMCSLEEKMKNWKLIGNQSEDFFYELEKCFFV